MMKVQQGCIINLYLVLQGGNGPPLAIFDVAAEKVPVLAPDRS